MSKVTLVFKCQSCKAITRHMTIDRMNYSADDVLLEYLNKWPAFCMRVHICENDPMTCGVSVIIGTEQKNGPASD